MNYGRFARSYQFLSRLVFGNALIEAQRKALDGLSPDCSLLIAGGGDGEILRHLAHWNGPIDFVEISAEMIAVAKTKSPGNIRWFQQDIFDFQPDRVYDIVLIPFLLDNFIPKEAELLIVRIPSFLANNSQVIIIDYPERPVSWQKILLKSMYLFFRITANVPVNALPPIETLMQEKGFCKSLSFSLYGGFIEVKYYHLC